MLSSKKIVMVLLCVTMRVTGATGAGSPQCNRCPAVRVLGERELALHVLPVPRPELQLRMLVPGRNVRAGRGPVWIVRCRDVQERDGGGRM